MPYITYRAANINADIFPNVKTCEKLNFTWNQLIWAAVTVGKSKEHQAQYGIYSAYERSMRMSMIYANLMQSNEGQIIKTPSYSSLDPSEKSAVSYYIGMTLVRLFSYQLLDVDWLLHLDLYAEAKNAHVTGRERPDFIGRNQDDKWLVFESKGRSGYVSGRVMNNLMHDAKYQASRVNSVSGIAPIGAFGAVTHFSNNGMLIFQIDDPVPQKSNDKSEIKLIIEGNKFFEDYYNRFINRKNTYELKVNDNEIIAANMGELDVVVGIDKRITDKNWDFKKKEIKELMTQQGFMGRDGIYVGLGSNWSQANMMKVPEERS